MTAVDEIKIGGMGASRRRVEDNRFIRGKGNYVDDIVLPGMLHMEILRSPLAHARIRSIDTSKAWAMPGVRLVLTGETMAARNLAWMPTLSYDTQAVLATDKVRFQGQEVACVVADDPYIAKDACEAIVVDYEPLPAIVNPMQSLAEGAPLIRDDKENQADNVIYDWEVGDKEGTDRAFAQADLISKIDLHYPRSHPSPIETCGSIADFNRSTSRSAKKTLLNACTNNEATRETLITTLRIVQELRPRYDLNGTRAIYDVSGQGLPYERFVLEREGDRWFIAE